MCTFLRLLLLSFFMVSLAFFSLFNEFIEYLFLLGCYLALIGERLKPGKVRKIKTRSTVKPV